MLNVIITCGKKKAITKSRAELMYVGSHFKTCLRWAKSKTTPEHIFILSAKYGLLKLTDVIEPYELKMGQKGCVTDEYVKFQASQLKIANHRVLSTAGKEYRLILDKVFKKIEYPFFNMALGYMKQAITRELRC